jgi:hypothetical protein
MSTQTQEELIKEQVTAKAQYAASVAAASGNVAKDAFINTIKGATTVGDKAVVFGALVGVVSFFLPWITLFGVAAASGFGAAIGASWVFWLHPLSMIACFVLASFSKEADIRKRILGARWYIVIGAVWFVPGVAAVCNAFSGAVGFGGYLATASAGAILLGGMLQISERLADLSKAA